MWLFINRYWFAAAPIGIVFGVFIFFTQHQSSEVVRVLTFSIITSGVITSAVFLVFYLFLFSENSVHWLGWAVLGLGILISIPFCYISTRFLYFGCVMIALPAGTSLALVL